MYVFSVVTNISHFEKYLFYKLEFYEVSVLATSATNNQFQVIMRIVHYADERAAEIESYSSRR